MNPSEPVPIVSIYKTNIGNFFRIQDYPNQGYYHNKSYCVNGKPIDSYTFKNNWFKIDEDIVLLEKVLPSQKILTGFKLKREEVASDAVPIEITDCTEWGQSDEDYSVVFTNKYIGLDAIYEPIYKETNESRVSVAFTELILGDYEISDPNNLTTRKITTKENTVVDLPNISGIVQYDELTKIITPEFAMHDAPCELSSKQVYSIIRDFIKKNYDRGQAAITSDYDFCFTVKKIVNAKPYITTITTTGRKNKLVEKQVEKTTKEIEIFEMTWDKADNGKPYGKYPVVNAIKCNNLQQIHDTVTDILQRLIKNINEPVEECQCCNGTGYLIKSFKFKGE